MEFMSVWTSRNQRRIYHEDMVIIQVWQCRRCDMISRDSVDIIAAISYISRHCFCRFNLN